MRTNSENRKPTNAEFNILGVIWEHGSATVREVYEHLDKLEEEK